MTRISIISPAPADTNTGNRVTAERWAEHLGALGHEARIEPIYEGEPCDVLVALHAKKSFASIELYRELHPNAPLVVALTGTDLYGDIHHDEEAQRSLQLATRLVVLQARGISELPEDVQPKARTIHQSATIPVPPIYVAKDAFAVVVIAHLRAVKDPFRAARASRLLPAESKIQIIHLGGALDAGSDRAARAEMMGNPRYRWMGEQPRSATLRILGGASMLVLTSESEGGANVVTEAIAASVPVISSRIEGSIGLLGEDYPGYFAVGDTAELAALLRRAETEVAFLEELKKRCGALKPLVDPAVERECWKKLLEEMLPQA